MRYGGQAGSHGGAEGRMDLLIGRTVGPYALQSHLGAGGMGIVYRAVHRGLDAPRAVKILPFNLAQDELFVTRFQREARLAARLRHPHIVQVHDVGEADGIHYIAMELLEGRSLRELILREGPVPLPDALALLRQLAEALDFAHGAGVAHRDVKPGNAFVSRNGHLTLVDFGIARAAEESHLTGTGMLVGTAEYMAPELVLGESSGMPSDLYALGIVAYELLTGRVPFTGLNSREIMNAQVDQAPRPLRELKADVPPTAEAVVLRQIAKRPEDRFRTASAFVRALTSAAQDTRRPPFEPKPVEAAPRGTTPLGPVDLPPSTAGRPASVVEDGRPDPRDGWAPEVRATPTPPPDPRYAATRAVDDVGAAVDRGRSQPGLVIPLAAITTGWVLAWVLRVGLRAGSPRWLDLGQRFGTTGVVEAVAYGLVAGLVVGLGLGVGVALARRVPVGPQTAKLVAAWTATIGVTSAVFAVLVPLLVPPLVDVTSLVVDDYLLAGLLASAMLGLPQGAAVGLLGGYLTARGLGIARSQVTAAVPTVWMVAVAVGELVYWLLFLTSLVSFGSLTGPSWIVVFRVVGGAVTGLLGGWLTLRALRR